MHHPSSSILCSYVMCFSKLSLQMPFQAIKITKFSPREFYTHTVLIYWLVALFHVWLALSPFPPLSSPLSILQRQLPRAESSPTSWTHWMCRVKVAVGVARGLNYLHEVKPHPLYHGSLKRCAHRMRMRLVIKFVCLVSLNKNS